MSSLAVTLERNLDVVRETLRVDPSRPMSLSEQARGARFRSGDADVGTRGIGLGVEELVDEWLGNALQVAAQAALLAEENSDSPAAWTRSAFAQLVAGRRDEALVTLQKSLDIDEKLAIAYPDDTDRQRQPFQRSRALIALPRSSGGPRP